MAVKTAGKSPKEKKSSIATVSSKKKKKGDTKEQSKEHAPTRLEIPGLFLLSIALISVIALLSEFVKFSGNNLLGPYLGEWWAYTLNATVGSLPILFLLTAISILGFKWIWPREERHYKFVYVFLLLFLSSGLLLSVHNIPKPLLLATDYSLSGGYVGNFLVQTFFIPLFGKTQFGPYLITSLAILFTLVWGYKVSVAAVVEKGGVLMGSLVYPVFDGLAKHKKDRNEKKLQAQSEAALIASLSPLEAATLPTRKRLKKENILAPEKENPNKIKETGTLPTLLARDIEMEDEEDYAEEDDGIDYSDPLAVRKSRDLNLERQRVTELNEWEQKSRSPEIAGLLLKEKLKENLHDKDSHGKEVKGKETGKEIKSGKSEAPHNENNDLRGVENIPVDGDAFGEEADVEEETFAPIIPMKKAAARGSIPKPEQNTPQVKYDKYMVPSLNTMFKDPPVQAVEFTEDELREQSKMLEAQLLNFKVMGKVMQICPGPVITRYELELAPGVKVNRISSLADDLALALKAKSIRILAPIPGKSLVGVEVPNRKAQIVYIKDILQCTEFSTEEDTLKICLGKTVAGDPYVMDLTRAPHLLIAGQTGSGKSVCINSIMASFLCSKTPDELRMILVDPKVVELKPYDEIPHLLYPVITQPEVAVQALKWSTYEMDRRYEVLALCGVRNIKGFNQKFREGKLSEKLDEADSNLMPYIVIVIDELADLMMVAGKEVETNIARIAQKARAVGIHLILATQRPSTNVITGTIKANLPTRIAFQVASQIDARTIMDKMGAEKLLGRGDMLFRPIEFPEPMRLHGCYLDDDQAQELAKAASQQHVNYPQLPTFNLDDDPSSMESSDEPRDAKFRDAAELVVQLKQASVSLLQRRLGIGYARSGRLVDQLERAGIVGRERGSKPREVLMTEEELNSFLSSGLND